MYSEAYALIREILEDEDLSAHVLSTTGKRLTVIDSGPQVTVPAAAIAFNGGEISRSKNTMRTVEYEVSFVLPYWGADGMKKCHDFLDVALNVFFSHEQHKAPGCRNFVIKVNPSLMEEDPEEKWWSVTLVVTVSMFVW